MKISREPDYQLDIIREMAIKNNIPVNVMRKIVYSPYRFVKEVIAEGECNKVLINGFVHFSVNPVKKERYFKKLNRNNETKEINLEEIS